MDITSYLLGKQAGGGGGGGSDLDWTAIGYENTPKSIEKDYNYAKNIKNNWQQEENLQSKFSNDSSLVIMPMVNTSNATNMRGMFNSCINLRTVPQLDTSNATTVRDMFNECALLEDVPIFNLSKITTSAYLNTMFYNCKNLTDESLDNILQSCISSALISSKNLGVLGFNSTNYPASRIQALPHYQDFIDAGWTIGY